jgi:hypothetical protein
MSLFKKEKPVDNPIKNSPLACFLYTYNENLAHKAILLHQRIFEWYKGNGIENHAIQNQHYLKQGSIRNDTLEGVMRRDCLSQIQAIEKIIFQHKLPVPLIRAVLTYGAIIKEDDGSLTVEIPVQVKQDNARHHYFLAEITGNICSDHIKIWHTFMRDIVIRNYMINIFEQRASASHIPIDPSNIPTHVHVESLMKQLTLEERKAHQKQDGLEGFASPLEIDHWEVIDTTACATIKQNDITYTIFKQ